MNDYSDQQRGAFDRQEEDGTQRFKKILADEANTIFGVKDAILAVMLRDGAATWQTVEGHLSAEYSRAQGEFTRFRLEATLNHLRRLSSKPAEPEDGTGKTRKPPPAEAEAGSSW